MMRASECNTRKPYKHDETGKRYGKLLVIERAKRKPAANRAIYWRCRCECDNIVERKGVSLRGGSSTSCGCDYVNPKLVILTGKRYGKLLVTSRAKNGSGGKSRWNAKCDCGRTITAQADALTSGQRASCNKGLCHGSAIGFELSAKNKILSTYKCSAKKTKKPFFISDDEFIELIEGDCDYCGKPPSQKITKTYTGVSKTFLYNGIDRVDSSLGYEPGNLVSSCGRCNVAKNSMSRSEFLSLVRDIYDNNGLGER